MASNHRWFRDSQTSSWQIDLPGEILHRIFSYYPDPQTLRSLALCSRRFHQHVMPLLFQSVYVTSGMTDFGVQNSKQMLNHGLRALTLHLLRKRSFGRYVRHVRLCGPNDSDFVLREPYADEIDRELEDTVGQHLHFNEYATTRLLSTGTGDLAFSYNDQITVFALLLALLPNLTSLHVQMPDARLLAKPFSASMFEGLRKITLEWIPSDGKLHSEIAAQHVTDLMCISSIREICVIRLEAPNNFRMIGPNLFAHLTIEPRSSLVTHFELRKSILRIDDCDQLLRGFQSLKTFIYVSSEGVHPSHAMLSRSFWSVLREAQGENLESVWLDYRPLDPRIPSDDQIKLEPPDRELRPEFGQLRFVALPLSQMFASSSTGFWTVHFSNLPPSLELMVLINHGDADFYLTRILEILAQFLADTKTFRCTFPNLRTIVVVAPTSQYEKCDPFILTQIGSAANVELIFATAGHSDIEKGFEDEAGSQSIQYFENLVGLSKLDTPRWRALDEVRLRHRCEQTPISFAAPLAPLAV